MPPPRWAPPHTEWNLVVPNVKCLAFSRVPISQVDFGTSPHEGAIALWPDTLQQRLQTIPGGPSQTSMHALRHLTTSHEKPPISGIPVSTSTSQPQDRCVVSGEKKGPHRLEQTGWRDAGLGP